MVAGCLAASLLIALLEILGHGLAAASAPAGRAGPAVGAIPASALIAVLVAWAAGSVTGGWVAARLAGRGASVAVALVLMAAGIYNMVVIPSPPWFWIGGLLVFLPFALIGARLARRAAVR